MAHLHDSAFGRLAKALHLHYDEIANEPLPRRWVELIHYLDERERKSTQHSGNEAEPGRRPRH